MNRLRTACSERAASRPFRPQFRRHRGKCHASFRRVWDRVGTGELARVGCIPASAPSGLSLALLTGLPHVPPAAKLSHRNMAAADRRQPPGPAPVIKDKDTHAPIRLRAFVGLGTEEENQRYVRRA